MVTTCYCWIHQLSEISLILDHPVSQNYGLLVVLVFCLHTRLLKQGLNVGKQLIHIWGLLLFCWLYLAVMNHHRKLWNGWLMNEQSFFWVNFWRVIIISCGEAVSRKYGLAVGCLCFCWQNSLLKLWDGCWLNDKY